MHTEQAVYFRIHIYKAFCNKHAVLLCRTQAFGKLNAQNYVTQEYQHHNKWKLKKYIVLISTVINHCVSSIEYDIIPTPLT
jgi:hypothetical protein